jgi:hypothetical protein
MKDGKWWVVVGLSLALGSRVEAKREDAVKVMGWAGPVLLYEPDSDEAGEPAEMGGSTGAVWLGHALDGRTGIAELYFLRSTGKAKAAEKKAWAAMPQSTAWQALISSAKPACAGAGRTGPDGATLEVELRGTKMKGAWKKDVYAYSHEEDDGAMEEKKATFAVKVRRGGKLVTSATWSTSSPNAQMGAGLSGTLRACWSPDGKRVAIFAYRAPGMMRDTADSVVLVGPTQGPRIQLVADKAILASAAQRVGAALEAAGFTPTASKASNEATPRAATVIYAAAGFEADAQKLATAVPGGATVAKLDWKAPFDLVVGIGAAATK